MEYRENLVISKTLLTKINDLLPDMDETASLAFTVRFKDGYAMEIRLFADKNGAKWSKGTLISCEGFRLRNEILVSDDSIIPNPDGSSHYTDVLEFTEPEDLKGTWISSTKEDTYKVEVLLSVSGEPSA